MINNNNKLNVLRFFGLLLQLQLQLQLLCLKSSKTTIVTTRKSLYFY